jgi:outer membrane protein
MFKSLYAVLIILIGITINPNLVCAAEPRTAPSTSPSPLARAFPHTLKEAYEAAVRVSETVQIQKELLTQTEELDTQAKASLFPQITGAATALYQEPTTNSTGNAIFPANQNTVRVSLDQPLFRGLRDFAALRQRKSFVETQNFAITNAARQLFYDLSTAYYSVLMYEHDEENYRSEIAANEKRLKELRDFSKIGRAKLTDLLTFQSNIASLEAQIEATRGQLEASKEVLAYLTGWDRNTRLLGSPSAAIEAKPVTEYLTKIEERSDIKVALSNVQAYDEGIPMAWGGHLPSVDLLGNYYFVRPGALADVNWDVSLALTIPIFQGGAIQSQVRQAESVTRQYRFLLSQARRLAEKEIRTFYDNLIADQKQLRKLESLTELSKRNYETQTHYFKNGLVTNLDVFQSLATSAAAQRQRDRQREAIQMDLAKLEAATGERKEISQSVAVEKAK